MVQARVCKTLDTGSIPVAASKTSVQVRTHFLWFYNILFRFDGDRIAEVWEIADTAVAFTSQR